MASGFEFILNGERVAVEGVAPDETLLTWLRARKLTGTKEGCAEGDCGACTVLVFETVAHRQRALRTVNACIALLPSLAGKEIWTVEGLALHGPHPVQKAIAEYYGSQCGFCTPGFVASLVEGCYRRDLATVEDLNEQLCGNLCRCTGYRTIRDAAAAAWRGDFGSESFAASFSKTEGQVDPYESAEGLFLQPTCLADLWVALAQHPQARMVAGGTEVGVEVAKAFRPHRHLVGLQRVRELLELGREEGCLRIGAGVPLTDVMPFVREDFPSLYDMLRWFASRPIRNRATLGGNLATASPIGDTAPVLIALKAELLLECVSGARAVACGDFFEGYRRTVLRKGEIIREIRLPLPVAGVRRLERSFKVSKRREMDISITSSAFCVDLDDSGIVVSAGMGFGGVGPTPLGMPALEATLVGRKWEQDTMEEIRCALVGPFEPITDGRATREYRAALPAELWRAFTEQPAQLQPEICLLKDLPPAPLIDASKHESAARHADGSARYVDDEAELTGALHVWPVVSPHARAKIRSRDPSKARAVPGVCAVLLAEDVPGLNDTGAARQDEPLFAKDEVYCVGQLVAAVVGESPEACRQAAALLEIDYEPMEAVVSLEEAVRRGMYHTEFNTIARGNVSDAMKHASLNFDGEFAFGGQEHFYLECQAAWAQIAEDDLLHVHSSTQHPSEAQAIIAHVLHLDRNRIVVQCPRMGGGFGGKETQGAAPAALAALAAFRTRRPCRARWNRDQDFQMTGKRHPFLARFRVGAADDGRIVGLEVELYNNGGWSLDLSLPICDRALFHLDNAYYLPNVKFCGRVCKTHLPSNTAFRGFGGPQGMLVIEEIIDRVARRLGLEPGLVRERNLYHGSGESNTTHYGQEIGDNRIQILWQSLKESANVEQRNAEIAQFNQHSRWVKRGIAQTPVKFGISFTYTPYNQAGALVLVYTDGSVQVNHGGTEMGQGLHTKILGVAARELGLPTQSIRVTQTRTDKVPNTSATAASSGSDLNGAAVRDACSQIRSTLEPVARELLQAGGAEALGNLHFANGQISTVSGVGVPFLDVVKQAYLQRVPLAAFGYYRTPEIHYDRASGRGRPFYYFACGCAVSEVEVDVHTGRVRVLRVDILHDVGKSLNLGIDRGQIEGGFVQGMGWLTGEELVWNEKGEMLSHGASTYQIPSIGDVPVDFRVEVLSDAAQPGTIHGSKAVGEPPLMLAISVREAIRAAVAACLPKGEVPLGSPATCEAVFRALHKMPSSADAWRRILV